MSMVFSGSCYHMACQDEGSLLSVVKEKKKKKANGILGSSD